MPKQPYRARAEPCQQKRKSVLIRQEHSLRISKHGILLSNAPCLWLRPQNPEKFFDTERRIWYYGYIGNGFQIPKPIN